MGAVVVYESMFGNTEAVARAVADGIATAMPVEVLEVGSAPPLSDLRADLLVVGAPTHAFGLSRPGTRQDAIGRGGRPSAAATGVREWLDAADGAGLKVAAFDTHVKKPNLPGRAGHSAERRLHRIGCDVVTRATSFYVDGYCGPLYPGEVQRATAWGADVARRVTAGAAAS